MNYPYCVYTIHYCHNITHIGKDFCCYIPVNKNYVMYVYPLRIKRYITRIYRNIHSKHMPNVNKVYNGKKINNIM